MPHASRDIYTCKPFLMPRRVLGNGKKYKKKVGMPKKGSWNAKRKKGGRVVLVSLRRESRKFEGESLISSYMDHHWREST